MSTRTSLALACAIGLAGCSHLNPAPSANETPGGGAVARANGVQMTARAGAWDGKPGDLQKKLTPMLVTIENNGSVPIRVRYSELMLATPKGMFYKALPPFQIDGSVLQLSSDMRPGASIVPVYPPNLFDYAPHVARYIANAEAAPGPFETDKPYWERYAKVMTKVDLPTEDMLRRALPEGVLRPGGRVQGFVYFPGVGDDIERVSLRADLMNANTGAMVTTLAIPFSVS